MDEQQPKRNGAGRFLWIFVLLAIVIAWWYFRGGDDSAISEEEQAQDRVAALASNVDVDPDDILVDLKDNASAEQVAAIENQFNIKLVLVDDVEAKDTQLYRAHVDPTKRDAIIEELSKNPEVEIVEPDAYAHLSPGEMLQVEPTPATQPGFPNDPMYDKQWNMRQIGMPEAWKLADGNGVIVAILDTGVGHEDYKNLHVLPDLKGIEFVDPYNFVSNNRHAGDDHAHGSHVAGTIAQMTNNGIGVAGIALNVKIMPLKVLSARGSGSVAGIADAIRYAADHKAKVINMSLGSSFPSNVLKKAVAYAHAKGVTIICAAGNDGRGKVGYPAAYPGAVAVSATQQDEGITFYSNWGKDIDIAAPGGNTTSDGKKRDNPDGGILQNTIEIGNPEKDGYFAFMGTSMASPHVAGVAALIVGEGVTDPNMVEKILKQSARKPNEKPYEADKYGAGIVDAPAAIKKVRTESGGWQLGLGVLMAGAVVASARRRRGLGVKLGPSYLLGVVIGASGLFFLPNIAPGIASLPGIHALTHGLPSWDMSVFGPTSHGNVLFFSALVPLVLLAIGYGVPRLRVALAGVAIGVAAHLAFFAVVPMVDINILGLSSLWLGANAIICLLLARLALSRE